MCTAASAWARAARQFQEWPLAGSVMNGTMPPAPLLGRCQGIGVNGPEWRCVRRRAMPSSVVAVRAPGRQTRTWTEYTCFQAHCQALDEQRTHSGDPPAALHKTFTRSTMLLHLSMYSMPARLVTNEHHRIFYHTWCLLSYYFFLNNFFLTANECLGTIAIR